MGVDNFVVENISCDKCGYYDHHTKFPDDVNHPQLYIETMRKFGWKDDAFSRMGIGTVCPQCGNHYSFDFDPDDKREQIQESQIKES